MATPAPSPPIDTEVLATRVIYHLLGRRWVWPPMHAVDIYPLTRIVHLTGRPVQEIISITAPDGTVLTTSDYDLFSLFKIRFTKDICVRYNIGSNPYARAVPGYPFGGIGTGTVNSDPFTLANGCADREWTIDYVYGSPPNELLRFAIWKLQEQYDLALAGSSACKLPSRVTSIVRQGISMTILDPADFLERGQTGVTEVDSILATFNPGKAKARARVFTATNPPALRLFVEQLELPYVPGNPLPAPGGDEEIILDGGAP